MIFIDLLVFLMIIIIIPVSIAGYGSILKFENSQNFFIDVFFGFLVISIITTILHFFFKINFLTNLFIFFIGLCFFYFNKNKDFKIFDKKNIFYLIIVLSFIPMYVSQKYHEDFGYYHLPYALSFLEEKIIFGFANIDIPFVYNSIWLNLYPLFFFENKNFNYLTLPSFLLFLSFILFSMSKILKNKENIQISDYYLVVILFYFLLKFTRISEFGVDFPKIIFSVISIYYFIKFYETKIVLKKISYFYYNFAFSIFSILIKLSAAPIILLTAYIFVSNFKNLKFIIFNFKFLIIYLLCSVFFVQQFIYTGCLLFPTNYTCLNVSWFSSDHLSLSKQLELINKSYSLARDIYLPEEYLSNFTWFKFWIKRSYPEILEHLLTIVIPTLLFIFCLKKTTNKIYFFNKHLTLYLFVILSLIFWLYFSPVFRFANDIFATLMFLILLKILISREFSKKRFLIFISIFIMFSFSKNIYRINNSNEIFVGIIKINNRFILNDNLSNENAKIFYPDVKQNTRNGWQGRLCWDTPFICSYQELEVKKKNGYLVINKLKN